MWRADPLIIWNGFRKNEKEKVQLIECVWQSGYRPGTALEVIQKSALHY